MSLGYRKCLTATQIDGPTLTAAAAATCLPATKYTLPAAAFDTIGQVLWGRLTGRISCAVTTPGTARFDLRLGGTVVFDSLALNLNIVAKVNVHFSFEFMLTLRAVGSAANFIPWGKFESEAVIASPVPTVGGSGVLFVPYNTAPVVGGNFDSQVAQSLDVFFTQTVATGSLTVHQAVVEAPRWE
jgi:hypothetical protein